MNILLIAVNAKYIHSNPAVFSLKACAGEYGRFVSVLEFTINQPVSYLLQEIYKKHPDVAAFSCYIWNRTLLDQLIPDLNKVLPDTDIWAGGPEVSYDTAEVLQKWKLRGVMAGAGEASFYRLCAAYASGKQEKLPAVLGGADTERLSLDEIPFWYENLNCFEHRIIYYESSRGCPFSCSYCLSSIEKTMDFRSVPRVLNELDFFLEKRIPQVKFVDRTFNCRKDHALPILRHILEHDNGITNFHFEIAADLLDEDYFAVLKQMRPGTVQLEIGVQSTCQKTIDAIERRMDFCKTAAVVRQILSWSNIHVHLDLIAGLPFEDLHTFARSFNDVYALAPHQLQLGFLKVLKGSAMRKHIMQYGLAYTETPPYEVLSTKWLSYGDICRLKQVEEMVEIYYNSGQFVHTLKLLSAYFASPYDMYASLADWYEEHHLFGISLSRLQRYECLQEFGLFHITASEKQRTVLKESIVYDLYLREHMKNRPSFLPSQEQYRDAVHDILYQEAQEHTLFPELSGLSYRELTKMLHAEIFEVIFENPAYVFFWYGKRNPLTKNCTVKCVRKKE